MKNIVKSKKGVLIVTMDLKEAIIFEQKTGIAPQKLRSYRTTPTFRAWLPKKFSGAF